MVKEIIHYVRAWIKGEPAELNIEGEIVITWWEIFAILLIIGLVIYLICK